MFDTPFVHQENWPLCQTWFLAGGIAPSSCQAAYKPRGAADLASSYDNLAAPLNGLPDGTYDAALGVAPTFATATGWTFNGSTQYLTTGLVPAAGQAWSFIICAGRGTGWGSIFGCRNTAGTYWFTANPHDGGGPAYHLLANGSIRYAGASANGTFAVAGPSCYLNGVYEGDCANPGGTNTRSIYIGATNIGSVSYGGAIIKALAVYSVVLTAHQVKSVTTAIGAY